MTKRKGKVREWVAQHEPMAKVDQPSRPAKPLLFTLEVFLLSGQITAKFAKQNPVISRTIQMRVDQTLEDLHDVIFHAYGRSQEHFFEFQFGKGPMDPKGKRYVMSEEFVIESDQDNPPAGKVDKTTLDSLGLKVGSQFGYWFDFGDDWWHQINIEGVEDTVPRGKFPKVIKRVGKSPPQCPEEDEADDEDNVED